MFFMSEEEFQLSRTLPSWQRAGYVESLRLSVDGFTPSLNYMPDGNPSIPFLGPLSMEVDNQYPGRVLIWEFAFIAPFIKVEADFRSLLEDHEFIHIRQQRENRFPNLDPCKKDGRFSLDLSRVVLPDAFDEEGLRRQVYKELHPFARAEIEAYENQLRFIERGERKCSDVFVTKMRERLAIYCDVL